VESRWCESERNDLTTQVDTEEGATQVYKGWMPAPGRSKERGSVVLFEQSESERR
jgi:hypothetical protein